MPAWDVEAGGALVGWGGTGMLLTPYRRNGVTWLLGLVLQTGDARLYRTNRKRRSWIGGER